MYGPSFYLDLIVSFVVALSSDIFGKPGFGGSPADSLEANSPGVEDLNKAEEDKKRKARAERFGLPVSSSVDEETKKKARLARFGMDIKCDSVEEEKREARAARFALPDNNITSILNKKVEQLCNVSEEGLLNVVCVFQARAAI
eukprot:Gb_18784 [translate_table: standard]